MTLVATPNMVVSELAREVMPASACTTPTGLMVLAIGVAYMLLTRNWLNAASPAGRRQPRRTLRDLIRDYRLAGRGLGACRSSSARR